MTTRNKDVIKTSSFTQNFNWNYNHCFKLMSNTHFNFSTLLVENTELSFVIVVVTNFIRMWLTFKS